MTQNRQVEDEMRWVAVMAEKLGLALRGEPEKQPEPRPDVALTLTDGKRIAVEVVEAMDEATRKGYSGALGLISRLIPEQMKGRGLAATVALSMSSDMLAVIGGLPGKEQRALATRVVELAAEALTIPLTRGLYGWIFEDRDLDDPEALRRTDRLVYVGDLQSRGIELIRSVTISPWSEPGVITATSGMGSGPSLIQEAIDRKAARRDSYDLSGVDEFWLLVVGSTGTGGSLDIHVAERNTFVSPFAQTVFLECYEKKCVRLSTTAPADDSIRVSDAKS